jgi:hypothetical protein
MQKLQTWIVGIFFIYTFPTTLLAEEVSVDASPFNKAIIVLDDGIEYDDPEGKASREAGNAEKPTPQSSLYVLISGIKEEREKGTGVNEILVRFSSMDIRVEPKVRVSSISYIRKQSDDPAQVVLLVPTEDKKEYWKQLALEKKQRYETLFWEIKSAQWRQHVEIASLEDVFPE